MKKTIIAVVLLLTLWVYTTAFAESAQSIEFADTPIVFEDDSVKIELLYFYEKEYNWAEGPSIEKLVSFKFYNKTDHELRINPGSFYLDVDSMSICMENGTAAPAPGKTVTCAYIVKRNTGIKEVPLESLDELYQLECTFQVLHVYEDSSKNYNVDVSFALAEILQSTVTEGTDNAETALDDEAARDVEQNVSVDSENTFMNETVREVVIPASEYSTLNVGSRGDAVKVLQQALINQGFLQGTADGIYGNGTATGVKGFQESVGLEATGIADSETQRILFGDEDEVITITLTGTYETDYMKVDGFFIDESYMDEKDENLAMVYMFYTVFTNSQNLKIDSKDSKLTINNVNTYTSEHYAMACTYMGSYYYSDYLKDVYVGDNLKVVETFKIPKADLGEGRTLVFSNNAIPDSDKISLVTDNIVTCSNAKTIAKVIDPEGYADMEYKLSDADADTKARVKNAINGYYWTFFVNNTSYKIEFSGDSYTLTTALGTTNGVYTIKNAFIVLENSSTGAINMVPYSWGTNDIELELADGFDVREL